MNFDTGMTVVIGPNGSGKSNIADAIRWVLGELSSKNIRGTKMEDVIFGGTDTRRPMGYAEVSLTFDNTEGEIALPIGYDEVTVTRKYYRSGDSEYMINGQNVRLRDITELFMNTGLGKSGYSVIGQGRIAEIISKKSEDRRGIFEEAAGIAKYRQRKSEAERKLEKVDDNLSRVTDILTELSARVGPLEKDAEKAKKFLEIYKEKKTVDVSLWLFEIDSVKSRAAKLTERFEITRHELEIAEDSLKQLDSRADLLLERMHENKEKSEDAHRESARLSGEKYEAIARIGLFERDVAHYNDEETRIRGEIEKRTKDGAALALSLEELGREQKKIEASFAQIEKDIADKQTEIEDVRKEIASLARERDDADASVESAKTSLQELRLKLSGLEGSKEGEAKRKEELEERLLSLREKIEAEGKELLAAEKTLADYNAQLTLQREKILSFEERQKENAAESARLTDSQTVLRVKADTVAGRIENLRRMEEHFEGYSNAVRTVMNRASSGDLQGVCGPVSKLLKVDGRCALAFEVALGGALQHIVTEDDDAAKRAIEELKRTGAGRTTFYPLSTIRPTDLDVDMRKLSAMRGFIGRADQIAQFDLKYEKVMRFLLGRTVICETLDDCSAISRAFSYKFRTVSLDGQIVNAGGSFTGGAAAKSAGILTRSSEIARLEKEKEEISRELGAVEDRLSALRKDAADLENGLGLEKQTEEILRVMYASADTDCKVRKAGADTDLSQEEALKTALETLGAQMANFNKNKAAIEDEIAAAVTAAAERQIYADKLTVRAQALEEERTRLIDEKNALLYSKSSAEKDQAINARSVLETTAAIASAKNDLAELQNGLSALSEKRARCKRDKADEEVRKEKLEAALKALEETDAELKKENEEFEKESAGIRALQKEKAAHREILLRDYTKLDAQMEAIKSEQDRFAQKLWEEYELSYAQAKELQTEEVTEDTRSSFVTRQNKLKARIRELGNVNVGAIDEYAEVKERYDTLSKQYEDLTTSRTELNTVISSLEKEMREKFSEVFSAINDNFRVVFRELFGGGTAELSLTDPENILESGIEIAVAPPGKIIKSLSLLSGGEQVFVAIAIFFAILRVNPAPFCLLDEIEAALDEVNVARFASYARAYSEKTQFIIITHRRGTMEAADTMYGVTMGERGISKVLPLRFDEIKAKTGIKF